MSDNEKLEVFYNKLYDYIATRKMTYLIDLRTKYNKVNIKSKNNRILIMPSSKIGPYIKGVKLLIKFEDGKCGFLIENQNLLVSSVKLDLSFDMKIDKLKNGYFFWWKTPLINLEKDFNDQITNIEYLLDSVALKIRFYRGKFSRSLLNNW